MSHIISTEEYKKLGPHNVKNCIECVHARTRILSANNNWDFRQIRCAHPDYVEGFNTVTGEQVLPEAIEVKGNLTKCGPAGKLFEARTKFDRDYSNGTQTSSGAVAIPKIKALRRTTLDDLG